MDFKIIEQKWQQAWKDAEIGVGVRDDNKPKFFIIWAYATVSGFQHTGHMRGYSYTDAISRYKRMTGHSVLLCAGGHATGNGAIAKAAKIASNDPVWVDDLKERGVDVDTIKSLGDVDNFVDFFSKSYVKDYESFGFLGDWQRFMTTTKPDYNKFIEWQFLKLKQKGHIIQKPYFANCCVVHGPVAVDPSEMDLSMGGTAEQTEYTLIKLAFEENNPKSDVSQFIVVATLRPETMFGQTNVWLDYDIEYVKISIKPNNGKEEVWIVSKEFAEKIKYQMDDVSVIDSVKGSELTGKFCKAPAIGRDIIILPSDFCDPDIGTGIVTSVPSDAPADYIGLKDLQDSKELCDKYNLDNKHIKAIELIPIIKSKGYSDFPAVDMCKKFGIKSQNDHDKLEEAKKEVYKIGFHTGVMMENAGEFAGMKVTVAKDAMKEKLISDGDADVFFDLSEEVRCRCGERVYVMKRDNAWFIEYSDQEWTDTTINHMKSMKLYPESLHETLPTALNWFSDRACAREGNWLGTKLPFDKEYTVEAISDSTLYPIYYLVTKYVNEGRIQVNQLTEKFFDFVFLGEGSSDDVSNETGLDKELINTIHEDVNYWYPLDINLGGKEHQTVHFPPFLMNHTALLKEEFWPKGIFVNYWVMQAPNQKLSKSKGGAQPIPGISEKYTVDGMRLYYANVSSPSADIYFEEETLLGYKRKVEQLLSNYASIISESSLVNEKSNLDEWFESCFYSSLQKATSAMDVLDFKTATNELYYRIPKLFTTYVSDKNPVKNKTIVQDLLPKSILTLGLFTPHLAEELNELASKEFGYDHKLIAANSWPIVDKSKINKEVELSVEYVGEIKSDIKDILRMIGNESPKTITLIISPKWKYEFFTMFKEMLKETRNPKEIIPKIMQTELKRYSKDIMKLIPACLKDGSKIPLLNIGQEKELELLQQFSDEISKEFASANISVELSEDSSHPKASNGSPSKPAIVVE